MRKSTALYTASLILLGIIVLAWWQHSLFGMTESAASALLLGYFAGVITHILQFAGLMSAQIEAAIQAQEYE